MVKNAEEKNHVECTDFGTACQQKVLVESRHLAVKDSVSQIKTTFPWKIHGIPKLGRLNRIRLSRDPHALLPILCQSGPVCCPYVMIQGNNRFGSMTLCLETEETIPSPDIENTLAAQVGHLHGTPLSMEDLLTLAARSYESIQIYAVPPKSYFINSLGDFSVSHVCRVTGTRSAQCVFFHVCMHWVLAFCEYASFFHLRSKGSGMAAIGPAAPWEPPNKSILDLSEGAESGAGPDSATLHQALACSIRDKPSMAWGRSELVQTFPCRLYPALAANLSLTRKHTARAGSFLAAPHHRTRASIAPAHHNIPRHSAAQLDRAGHADKSIAWPHPAAPP